MGGNEPQRNEGTEGRWSERRVMAVTFALVTVISLIRLLLGPSSSAGMALLGLGNLVCGAVAAAAMLGVARDGWAAARIPRRLWLAFAVTITVIMVIGGVGTLIGGLLGLVL